MNSIIFNSFYNELEKIAVGKKYLYHYFSPTDIKGMVELGGIIAKPRNIRGASKTVRAISTTRLPKETSFIKGSGHNKSSIRFKISEEKLRNNVKVKPFADPVYGKRSHGSGSSSEFEELIIPKGKRGPTGTILPWKNIESAEIVNSKKFKESLSSVPGFVDNNPKESFTALSKLIKIVQTK